MAADYLISSLQPLSFDGPAPYTAAQYLDLCRAQLDARTVEALTAILQDQPLASPTGPAAAWTDLVTQLRNAIAVARARAKGLDPAKWRHAAEGCSLYWANRVKAAFQEQNPAQRDRQLDQVWWDAAGELTPPESPLGAGALATYAIRLKIALKRSKISKDAGNASFDRLTAETKR